MNDTKLTVRVSRDLLKNAKDFAAVHHTTLTQLINTYLQQIPAKTVLLDNAPIVRQLSGILSSHVSPEDYKKHLDEKYGKNS
jgi:hypothetical protein